MLYLLLGAATVHLHDRASTYHEADPARRHPSQQGEIQSTNLL